MFTLANNRFPSEYRCIFLSGPASPTGGFLSESGLRSIEREVQKQESVEAASSPSEATANVKSCLFFNKQIAEQVSRANYLIAEVKHNTGNVFIDSTATDNFGNPLVEGKSYTPVILSVANAAGSELEKYTGSISDYENTGWYVHQPDSKKQ
jgi:hypothetical protein